MEPIGLAALFSLLLVKEAGVPIPIPGDLLVLGAGVAAAHGGLDPLAAIVAILAAGVVGGSLQFALVRGGARRPLLALLERVGLRRARVERQAERLRRRGAGGVAVARMTPGLRVVAIAASALAGVPFVPFVVGLTAGNAVFAGGHFAAGLLVGEPALRLVANAGPLLALVGVALALVGAAAWWLIRRRRAARPPSALRAQSTAEDAFADWADATCPACLALGVIGSRLENQS